MMLTCPQLAAGNLVNRPYETKTTELTSGIPEWNDKPWRPEQTRKRAFRRTLRLTHKGKHATERRK